MASEQLTEAQAQPGQLIELASLPNLRDVGGWPTVDGRVVRRGMVFRSTALHSLSDDDTARLRALRITTIYDLRTARERLEAPDAAIGEQANLSLDVLADTSMAIPAKLHEMLVDPAVVARVSTELTGGKGVEHMSESYRHYVTLPSAIASYRRMVAGLLGEDPAALLIHCTTGKDRTGWGTAVLLSALGVAREDIYREYLLTNEHLLPTFTGVFAKFAEAGGAPELLRPLLGGDAAYLDQSFAEADRVWGGMDEYLSGCLGLDDRARERLRNRLLV